jgi:LysR family transcriptional regulator, transcriptional activator of nhaA
VKEYADEIFSLGAELTQRMKSLDPGTPIALNVGIVNSIPKLISYQILAPALESDQQIRLTCWEGSLEHLLSELAIHRLDLVISDHPIPTGLSVRAYNHPLGESGVSFFAGASMAARYAPGFPDSLDGAPVLLPMNTCALRRRLDDWFEQVGVQPLVVAEFDDSALMKAFAVRPAPVSSRRPVPSPRQIETMYSAREDWRRARGHGNLFCNLAGAPHQTSGGTGDHRIRPA